MPWLIDTDVFIEGERGNPLFEQWLATADSVATPEIVSGEFLIGVHAVNDEAVRNRGLRFYETRLSKLPFISTASSDFETGAKLAGEARRQNKGKPSLIDGIIAAMALRLRATVASRNTKDFRAMGCACQNPFAPKE